MLSYRLGTMTLNIEKNGANQFVKATHPIKVGSYSEIITPGYEFTFNLNGEIKFIRGLGPNWRHPGELLKRTDGNDWVFYSLGTVGQRVVSWLGEYYLPCLTYASNPLYEFNPFNDMGLMQAFAAWSQLYGDLAGLNLQGLPPQAGEFIQSVVMGDDNTLYGRATDLHRIIGGRPSVLPPDTRHVDYEVIPLTIADGCRYHCRFCAVKSKQSLNVRSPENIREQIAGLKEHYGRNMQNYTSIFLANHDALAAGKDVISMAAEEAAAAFAMAQPTLFLFGSVDSLLEADNSLWPLLEGIAERAYINVGFESADAATLRAIGKPLDAAKVRDGFAKMIQLNRQYSGLKITGNFLLGEDFPAAHYDSLARLLGDAHAEANRNGAVYLSPLVKSRNRIDLLDTFFELQKVSTLPAYIYLIQRL